MDDFDESMDEDFVVGGGDVNGESKGLEERKTTLDSDDDEDEIVVMPRRKRPVFVDDEAEDDADNGSKESPSKSDKVVTNLDLDAEDFLDDFGETDVPPENDEAGDDSNPTRDSTSRDLPSSNKDRAVDDDADDDMEQTPVSTQPDLQQGNEDDVATVFDIGALKAMYDPIILGEHGGDDENSKGSCAAVVEKPQVEVRTVVEKAYFQPSFQPTSTPANLEQRFMVWNETGVIRAYHNDSEDTIDVEFHDVSVHHPHSMPNTSAYTLATLSPEVIVLANEREDEFVNGKVFVMNFSTWDESNKEWKLDLSEDEFAVGLAVGDGFIAIATDKRFVRIVSLGGIQLALYSIPGNIVCIAVQENSIFTIYNAAPGTAKNPILSSYILKFKSKTSANFCKQPLPNALPISLTTNSTLVWAGFSDEGTPCTVDSAGYLRLLKDAMGNTWIPMMNLKESCSNNSDNYWVIGVSEIMQQVRCVFCKGSRYPLVIPRPQVSLVSFEIPLCQRTTPQGKWEEQALRSKLSISLLEKLMADEFDVESQVQECYKKGNEALLRLFALFMNANCEALALDVARLMPTGKLVENAMKIAKERKCTTLAEKLRGLANEKYGEPEEAEEAQEYEASPRKSALPVLEERTLLLRPKSLGKQNGAQEIEVQDSDDGSEVEALQPRRKKRKTVEEVENPREVGLELFFEEKREQLENENPDLTMEELKDVARDLFMSLPLGRRKQYR